MVADIADALAAVLPEQRWFSGKGRPIHAIIPLRAPDRAGADRRLVHAVVEVDQGELPRDRYQFLFGVRSDVPENLGHAWVAASGDQAVYQAENDVELTVLLLDLMARGTEVQGLRFATEPGVTLDTEQRSRPVGAEQSNTSLVYGQTYILKLFRKVAAGRNRDLELHRALAAVGCQHIAAPLGSIEGPLDSAGEADIAAFGMLTEYLRNAAEGWAMATASVRDLLAESLLIEGAPGSVEHADPADVGGDFASEAYRLGHVVATVHTDLATALGSSPAPAGYLDMLADGMHRRLDGVLEQVPALSPHSDEMRAAFDAVRGFEGPLPVQQIHGDLHLGQVLRSVTGWVLIDFEGEPMVPVADRDAPASPLRDVAAMLRSLDYAANHLPLGETDSEQRAAVALAWSTRNQDAFCDGYAQAAPDPRKQAVLLRAFELDKAVYEVAYEHGNRPLWLPIPLAAIARLTATHP